MSTPPGASATKTIYIKPADRKVWLELEQYARTEGLSVSFAVTLLIRRFLRERAESPGRGYL
jgi:hypothetical protein